MQTGSHPESNQQIALGISFNFIPASSMPNMLIPASCCHLVGMVCASL
jgi:hypothetical protein